VDGHRKREAADVAAKVRLDAEGVRFSQSEIGARKVGHAVEHCQRRKGHRGDHVYVFDPPKKR